MAVGGTLVAAGLPLGLTVVEGCKFKLRRDVVALRLLRAQSSDAQQYVRRHVAHSGPRRSCGGVPATAGPRLAFKRTHAQTRMVALHVENTQQDALPALRLRLQGQHRGALRRRDDGRALHAHPSACGMQEWQPPSQPPASLYAPGATCWRGVRTFFAINQK